MENRYKTPLDPNPGENGDPAPVLHFERADNDPDRRPLAGQRRPGGLLKFFGEIHRRRVSRAATMYAVALWLILQIIELVKEPLGLPAWTLQLVIVLGLLGLPIAIVVSWLFDVTPDGLVADSGPITQRHKGEAPSGYLQHTIDLCLVTAALVIAMQLAFGVFSTPAKAAGAIPSLQKIAVMPLRIASGTDTDWLAAGLFTELQHELARSGNYLVVAPLGKAYSGNGLRLAGAVSADIENVRITVMLIDNTTDTVTWSKTFWNHHADVLATSSTLASEIVRALPGNFAGSEQATGKPEV